MATGHGPDREFVLVRVLRRPGKGWWLIAPALFTSLGIASYFLQDRFKSLGNTASILGLAISVVGFVLTIWAVLETQRIDRETKAQLQSAIKEAQDKIETAQKEAREQLAEARQETRDALGKVKRALFLTDYCEAYHLVKNARVSIRARQWTQAKDLCEGMRRLCLHILHRGLVSEAPEADFNEAMQKLPALLAVLTKYESEKPKVDELTGKEGQWDMLDRIQFQLETVDAFNRSQVLEAPNAERA